MFSVMDDLSRAIFQSLRVDFFFREINENPDARFLMNSWFESYFVYNA